jgi:hypothetical protein
VVKDTVMAQVDIQAGPFRVVSLMSREAVDDMDLHVGSVAVAPDGATRLGEILNACPELQATAVHVRASADIVNKRRGDRIHSWLQAVTQDNLPALHSLATGLRRDLDAIIAGLSTHWNSGPAEGNVNLTVTWNPALG